MAATATTYAVQADGMIMTVQISAEQSFLPPELQHTLACCCEIVVSGTCVALQNCCVSKTIKDRRALTGASMQKKTHLIDVLGCVLFEIHRPPDFEVGLTVQVGGLDEAHLHTHPSHVVLHCSCIICSQLQPRVTC